MEPKISIIIPVFNGGDFLQEAIDSALAQTYPNIEIVVVNDGSNDAGATERIARGYGDRIVYAAKPNGGVASALNMAIELATGDYLSWLSHDDLYTPQKLQRQVDFINTTGEPDTIVYSDFSVFTKSSDQDSIIRLRGVPAEQFRYWITVENSLHGCTLLIPRKAFERCGKFNESLRTTQDYDLWFRMAKEFRFVHIPEVFVKARNHAQQGSVKMADTALRECNALLSNFVESLSADELSSGSGAPPTVGYIELARSMRMRGFTEAASTATRLSLQNLAKADMKAQLRTVEILAKIGTTDMLHRKAKALAKKILPRWVRSTAAAVKPSLGLVDAVNNLPLKEKFSEVYTQNIFGGVDSRSGAGSDLMQTEVIRTEIPGILQRYGVKSMLDAPCGDWFWMQHVHLGVERYIGVDIVDALIEKNRTLFAKDGVEFASVDLSKDKLPSVDLIFSRDCLVHLSYADALKILRNFKASDAVYLLTTTFTDRNSNEDLGDGFWRPLNLRLAPFNFPAPLELVNEKCTEGGDAFADKSIALWRFDDLKFD
ncbi:glycosyltransferase [Rhizobium ruizarguesonis]|uniref:glycosyltransferase n=1 Tax=Rhizobium ruizarguesonis TaxID=2081791 RepID=UPI0013EECCE6|nr:glycosyltransferase [Rhizobium ruizarguesonis]